MISWFTGRIGSRLIQAVKNWRKDEAGLMAAAISYYASLSFFPLLLVLISVFGMFLRFSGWGHGSQRRILELIAANSSPELAGQVKELLQNIERQALVGGPLGLLTLVISALALFTSFQYAFDRIWKVQSPSRGYVAAAKEALFYRFRSFLMLLGVGLLVLATFVVGMALSAIGARVTVLLGNRWLWQTVQVLITMVLNLALIAVLYRSLPKVPVSWSAAAQGALLAAFTWEIGRQLLAAWIIGGRYGAYGVVGTFIALLLWTYYAASVVLLGAEYARTVHDCHNAGTSSMSGPRLHDCARQAPACGQ